MVIKGLQEAGNDMCRGRIMGSLRSESGGQATESNYGSGVGPKIDPVLDADMVLAGVKSGRVIYCHWQLEHDALATANPFISTYST